MTTLNKKLTWGGVSSYETPLVKTLDILSEGVLCASGTFGIRNWEEEDPNNALNF